MINQLINSLPNNKILNLSIFEVFADDNKNTNEKLKYVLEGEENMVRKGENAYFPFPQYFHMAYFLVIIKTLHNVINGLKRDSHCLLQRVLPKCLSHYKKCTCVITSF